VPIINNQYTSLLKKMQLKCVNATCDIVTHRTKKKNEDLSGHLVF
jgi:hypothetical protein